MENSPKADVKVRPGFALVVFGSGAAIFALALIYQAELPLARACLFAWFLSLVFLSLRGFWNQSEDAFASVNQQVANSAVALLFVAGVAALFLEGSGPGAGLLVLAFLWALLASDFWSAKLHRIYGDPNSQIVFIAVIIVLLVVGAILDKN